jgi:hypothetical protein
MKLAESLHALGERHNRRLMHGAKAIPNVDIFDEEAFDLHSWALGKISSGDSRQFLPREPAAFERTVGVIGSAGGE